MKKLLASIEGKTVGQDIKDEIKNVQDEIDKLCKYIRENIKNLDKNYLSGQITIIKEKLADLSVTVKNFISNLTPDTNCKNTCNNNYTLNAVNCQCECLTKCDLLSGVVNNRRYCQCYPYKDAVIVYKSFGDIDNFIKGINSNGADPVKVRDFLTRFYALKDEIWGYKGHLEYYVTEMDLVAESVKIREYEERIRVLKAEYNEWFIYGSGGNCTIVCKPNEFRHIACGCYSSSLVETYYTAVGKYNEYDMKIMRFNLKGSKEELDQFKLRSAEVGKDFQAVYDYLYNNSGNYDEAKIKTLVETAQSKAQILQKDFDAWVLLNNPPVTAAPCAPSCQANQIISTQPCSCVTINDWDKLKTVVENGLPALLADINSLSDSENKETLTENW